MMMMMLHASSDRTEINCRIYISITPMYFECTANRKKTFTKHSKSVSPKPSKCAISKEIIIQSLCVSQTHSEVQVQLAHVFFFFLLFLRSTSSPYACRCETQSECKHNFYMRYTVKSEKKNIVGKAMFVRFFPTHLRRFGNDHF